MTKLVNKEKKRDWKLINEYHNGVACLVVFFTVFIDLASVLEIVILEKILLVLAIITVTFCLFCSNKYKQILDHFPNKELLSDIINAYTPGIMILPKVKEDEEMPKARAVVPELERMVSSGQKKFV